LLSQAFERSGADVIPVSHYAQIGSLDVTWSPFICGVNAAITAKQWHYALTELYAYSPQDELPVFTNRAKTMQRLSEFHDTELALSLQESYDDQLKELFQVSSKWSVIHGDAHGGNALLVNDQALLFDFDTTCWAPSVWDLTHLLNRAGDGVDSGYTAKELTSLFDFTAEEIDAGLTLRRIASKIAQKHREQSYFYGERNERENHDRAGTHELLVAQG
jgi:Ser/Thr protein kinase RdoA (MazF antagonist)